MKYEKVYSEMNISNIPNNVETIKQYFEKKNAICMISLENKKSEYLFEDILHSKEIFIIVEFLLDANEVKIIIEANDEHNRYEIKLYADNIFSDIYRILLGGASTYLVRMYAKYYSHKSLDLDATINWKSRLNVISFGVEDRELIFDIDNIVECPKEQMLFFDIEVLANDITAARTIAYNRVGEFYPLLSVVLDLGIELFQTEQCFILANENLKDRTTFYQSVINKGFYDVELDLFVYDNLNGLIAIDSNDQIIINCNISANITCDNNTKIITMSKRNDKLNDIFKNREFTNIKRKYKQDNIDKKICFYDTDRSIVSEHITFFRQLRRYEQEFPKQYEYLVNASRLYNKAITVLANEPTMMIAYLISSIEALLKAEKKSDYLNTCKSDMEKFVSFSKEYLDDAEFNRDYLRFLYGNIRSGHLHSGEFKFFEYDMNLDQSFNSDFFIMQKDYYIKAKAVIRSIFINWIEKNILNKKKKVSVSES